MTYNDWREVRKLHPAWFKELFRWLKDRSDNSYQIITWGMKHCSYPIFSDQLRYIRKDNLISWLCWYAQVTTGLKIGRHFLEELNEDWCEHVRRT